VTRILGPLLTGLFLILALGLGAPGTVRAATVFPFAIFIEQALDFTMLTAPDGTSVSHSADRPIYALVNGQKGAEPIGAAAITVWARSVPDPFFAPFGSLVGVGVLRFPDPLNLIVHLGLVQTVTGDLKTTIAAVDTSPGPPHADPTVWGNWVIGDATTVGGTAQDLVIAGAWIAGAPSPLAAGTLSIDPHVPTPAFVSNPTPTGTTCLNSCLFVVGSFYGQAAINGETRAVRAHTFRRVLPKTDDWAHLLVIDLGGGSYAVVACSEMVPSDVTPHGCTLSGIGPAVENLTGSVDYGSATLATPLTFTPFTVP
jgi:hypothetical protein